MIHTKLLSHFIYVQVNITYDDKYLWHQRLLESCRCVDYALERGVFEFQLKNHRVRYEVNNIHEAISY